MHNRTRLWLTGCLALLLSGAALAHPMTEKYIPLGAYPGWQRGTVQGTVDAIRDGGKTLVVVTSDGRVSTTLGEQTRIWLDRSALRQRNLDGSVSDLRPGQQVEIRRDGGYGRWVKVRVAP